MALRLIERRQSGGVPRSNKLRVAKDDQSACNSWVPYDCLRVETRIALQSDKMLARDKAQRLG
jgi:hypothetical protein